MDHKDHHSVDHFLTAWKSAKNIEVFLDQRIVLPSPSVIHNHLDTLSQSDKMRVTQELSEIMAQLETHAKEMEKGLKNTQEQLSKSRDTQEMCVSYEKADEMNQKGKEKE